MKNYFFLKLFFALPLPLFYPLEYGHPHASGGRRGGDMLPAHQLQGELAIPVPEYGHPHATNNGACSRDAPGPTNSLPLHPRGGAAERRPHRCSGHQHGLGFRVQTAGSQTRHRHGAPVRAERGTPAPAPRARARTTRHARTCNGATVEVVSAASSSNARTFAYVQAECAHVAHR